MRSLSEQRSPLDMTYQTNIKNINFQRVGQRSPSHSADVPQSFYKGVGADLKDLKPNDLSRYIKSEVPDICHFLPPLSQGTDINYGLSSPSPIRRINKQSNADTRTANNLRRNIGLPINLQQQSNSELPNGYLNNNKKIQSKYPNQSMELNALWSQDERKMFNNRENFRFNLETQDSETENIDQFCSTYHRNQKEELKDSRSQPFGSQHKPSISPKLRNKVHSKDKTRLDNHFPFSPLDDIDQQKITMKQKHLPQLNQITNKKIYQNQTRLRHSAHLNLKEHPSAKLIGNSKKSSDDRKQNTRYELNPSIDHTFIKITPRQSEITSRILREIQQLEVGYQVQEKENEKLLKASQKQCIREFQETCMYRALQPEISKLKPIQPSIPTLTKQEKRSSSANLKKPLQKAFLFSGTGLKERQEIKAMISSLENYSQLIKETTNQRKSLIHLS